jgi:aminoglycoside/choline kinase family phosphotransferase
MIDVRMKREVDMFVDWYAFGAFGFALQVMA